MAASHCSIGPVRIRLRDHTAESAPLTKSLTVCMLQTSNGVRIQNLNCRWKRNTLFWNQRLCLIYANNWIMIVASVMVWAWYTLRSNHARHHSLSSVRPNCFFFFADWLLVQTLEFSVTLGKTLECLSSFWNSVCKLQPVSLCGPRTVKRVWILLKHLQCARWGSSFFFLPLPLILLTFWIPD